jgi:hypothetical protein
MSEGKGARRAAPFLPDPEHGQSYNRDTYVWNKPTNLTDPTGFLMNDDAILAEVLRVSLH